LNDLVNFMLKFNYSHHFLVASLAAVICYFY
jgi:hypothetical protein